MRHMRHMYVTFWRLSWLIPNFTNCLSSAFSCFPAFLAFLVLSVSAFADSTTMTYSGPIQICSFYVILSPTTRMALLEHSTQCTFLLISLPRMYAFTLVVHLFVCFIMNKCLSFAFLAGSFGCLLLIGTETSDRIVLTWLHSASSQHLIGRGWKKWDILWQTCFSRMK